MNADDEHRTDAESGAHALGKTTLVHPGELIAGLPAMLGFVPARSVVLALIRASDRSAGRREIRSVLRFDTGAVAAPSTADELLRQLDVICRHENAVAAVAVIVDDRPHAAATALRTARYLQGLAVGLSDAWFVPEITSGARYRGLLADRGTGFVDDPSASPIAFAQVLDGVRIHGSRAELAAVLDPDPDLAAAVEPHLGPAITRYRDSLAAAVDDELGNPHRRATVESILALIADDNATSRAPADLAAVIAALRDRTIRDIMFGLAGTALGPAARKLWHLTARASSGPDRAEAATLCGYDAYYRFDGTGTAVCLEAALREEPSHPIAVMLHTSLSNGLHPDKIRVIAELGRQVAIDHGIDLP
ncbi:DUF4192 domain-containing protein [Nocardia asteroides]